MSKQFNPFPPVSGKYGAPMGRYGDNPANLQDVKRLCARRAAPYGDYDKGGAYFGNAREVWAVWARIEGEVVCCYVRANSRADAIRKIHEGEE